METKPKRTFLYVLEEKILVKNILKFNYHNKTKSVIMYFNQFNPLAFLRTSS